MRVVSLINGSLLSEKAALYAVYYAKQLKLNLTFIHIESNDSMKKVIQSVENLELQAQKQGVKTEFITLKSLSKLKKFVENKGIDIIFCSTRQNHSILDKSFVKKLISEKIKADLAIIKIVQIAKVENINSILLPIRETRLSVKKFALMEVFAKVYNAKVEIYSLDKISAKKLSNITSKDIKQKLQEVLFKLRHYIKMFHINNISFAIKHDFSLSQGDRVKEHIAKHNYDLAIIGAHKDDNSIFNKKHPIDILFKIPLINTLYFIPHKD